MSNVATISDIAENVLILALSNNISTRTNYYQWNNVDALFVLDDHD